MTNQAKSEIASVSAQQAREKFQAGVARGIDVRMPFDYAGGRIAGSLSLPNTSIQVRGREVPQDKELIFYSDDGVLSRKICALALSLGYKHVHNLEGGMEAWIDAGLPVETISEGLTSPSPSGNE